MTRRSNLATYSCYFLRARLESLVWGRMVLEPVLFHPKTSNTSVRDYVLMQAR